MAFLNGIEQIRSVEWGATYLWDVKFPDAPPPFDSWFPAVDLKEDLAKLSTYDFEAYIHKFSIPQSTSVKEIHLTFLDDAKQTLSSWIDFWINQTILNGGQSVSSLETSLKLIQILKLNRQREQVSSLTYAVFPEGNITFSGSSDTGPLQYSVTFKVAGIIGQKRTFP
jgi:hypothetical protein